jgi:hypothetical protein
MDWRKDEAFWRWKTSSEAPEPLSNEEAEIMHKAWLAALAKAAEVCDKEAMYGSALDGRIAASVCALQIRALIPKDEPNPDKSIDEIHDDAKDGTVGGMGF